MDSPLLDAICMACISLHILMLLSVWVFVLPLETNAHTGESSNHILKTHSNSNSKSARASHNCLVKSSTTLAHSSNYCSKSLRDGTGAQDNSPPAAPLIRRHVSHAHTQLRLATHKRTEIKNEINFPAQGGRQALLAPLNLRFSIYSEQSYQYQSQY